MWRIITCVITNFSCNLINIRGFCDGENPFEAWKISASPGFVNSNVEDALIVVLNTTQCGSVLNASGGWKIRSLEDSHWMQTWTITGKTRKMSLLNKVSRFPEDRPVLLMLLCLKVTPRCLESPHYSLHCKFGCALFSPFLNWIL